MSAEARKAAVAAALQRLALEMPRTAADAAALRRRTRELDQALGARMRHDRDEEA